MRELQTALATGDADLEALAPSIGWAFGDTSSGALDWLKRAGRQHVRIARQGGALVGGLVEVPMGQWFGGESVRTMGLAGVAVAPEARGQGVALELMRQTLRAARERGFALSTLYPSTYALYRKAGYELAGSHCRFTLQLRRLTRARSALDVHAIGADRQSELTRLYSGVARQRTGYLDRNDYIWQRVQNPEREPGRAFGVTDAAGLSGYVVLKAAAKSMPIQFVLGDFVTRTPQAFQSLLMFLADHLTTAEHATWRGGPSDARLFGLPDRVVQVGLEDYWMLRLVDVQAALLARGYPAVDAAVELVVSDELLPENGGRHPLVVEQGRARIAALKGLPAASLSVGSLAALYSGFVSPHELCLAGQLTADDRALRALAALFAGPAPGLPDFF